jgi:hypothetical protein
LHTNSSNRHNNNNNNSNNMSLIAAMQARRGSPANSPIGRSPPSTPASGMASLTPTSATRVEARAAQGTPPAPPPVRASIQGLQVLVQTLKEQSMKETTKKMYTSKMAEYYGMCDHVYPDVPQLYRYNVDSDHLYRLIFNVVFRNKKQRKGVKRGQKTGFNAVEYDAVEKEW